ncbi:hypothetical protein, partial [Escherichia coli]|uniref:hypothetical protein n=1 Tax=Escherichia coli TaxID=562 RepID=UPI001386CEEB
KNWVIGILIILGLALVAHAFGLTEKFFPLLKPEFINLGAFLFVTGIVVWILVATSTKPSTS